MTRALWHIACCVLGVVFACNGGALDAFVVDPPVGSVGGGSGGTTAGGTGGTSGVAPAGGEGGSPDSLLIDDFEDGDQRALLNNGEWFVSNDGTGVQTLSISMASVERPESAFALHTSGLGFERFGSVVCDIAGVEASFDASDYAALTFSARAEQDSATDVLFSFLVGSQHFAVPLRFGTDWDVHTIPFADAIPVEQGPLSSFDPRTIAAIQFSVSRPQRKPDEPEPPPASFDFWLDDLAFVK